MGLPAGPQIARTATVDASSRASITVAGDAATAVGDLLVAVLYAADVSPASGSADASSFTLPAGWSVRWLDSVLPTGDPRRLSAALMVAVKTATAAGEGLTVSWPATRWIPDRTYKVFPYLTNGAENTNKTNLNATLALFRFTGMEGISEVASARMAGQTFTYPAAGSGAPVGHVLRVGGAFQALSPAPGSILPTGGIERVKSGPSLTRTAANWSDSGYLTSLAATTADLAGAPAPAVAAAGRGDGVAATLLVTSTVAPESPDLVHPDGVAAQDLTLPWTLSWVAPAGQVQYQVTRQRVEPSVLSIEYWTGAGWSGTFDVVDGADDHIDSPGMVGVAAGEVYEYAVTVATDTAPDLSAPAHRQITHYLTPAAPTVTTTPAGPTMAHRAPTVTVAGSASSGASVISREVQIVHATTGVVLASGSTTGTSWTVPAAQALPNDTDVLVRGRIVQTGGMVSPWAQVARRVEITPQPAPSVTAQATTHPVSGLPGALLGLTVPAGQSVSITRDGVAVGVVPGRDDGALSLADWGAHDGVTIYELRVLPADDLTGVPSLPAVVTVTLTGADCWMIDPARPEAAAHAHIQDVSGVEIDLRTTVFEPLDTSWMTVHGGIPAQPSGSVVVQSDDPDTVDRVRAMLVSGRALVLRGWVERDGRGDAHYSGDTSFIPVGSITIDRPASGPHTWRTIAFSWVSAPREGVAPVAWFRETSTPGLWEWTGDPDALVEGPEGVWSWA